jgi:hypothetical protein
MSEPKCCENCKEYADCNVWCEKAIAEISPKGTTYVQKPGTELDAAKLFAMLDLDDATRVQFSTKIRPSDKFEEILTGAYPQYKYEVLPHAEDDGYAFDVVFTKKVK